MPGSIVDLVELILCLLLYSCFAFWLSVLLANLLVMLKFKGTPVAQTFT